MDTPTYVAIFEDNIPEGVVERAEGIFDSENIFRLSDTVLLLRVDLEGPKTLGNVLDLADGAHTGVIFRLNGSYSGYHYEKLWDWLKAGR